MRSTVRSTDVTNRTAQQLTGRKSGDWGRTIMSNSYGLKTASRTALGQDDTHW